MSRPAFLFRPEPGWSASAETLRGCGIEVFGQPLFAVEPVAWNVPEAGDYDGLLAGSSNAFRHGGEQLAGLVKLPVHAVGERTAEAAQLAGFHVAGTGRGGLQDLLEGLAGRRLRLLRLAGEDHVGLEPPAGIGIDRRIVYRAAPLPLDGTTKAALRRGGVAVLHSGQAARHFRSEIERVGLAKSDLTLALIGPRLADLAGEGWAGVHVAAQPGDAELLALAQRLCQTPDN